MSVYVFLNDQYADWELGYVLPELRCPPAVPQIKKKQKAVKTFSISGDVVQSMGGLRVAPDCDLKSVLHEDVEALILPGGYFWDELKSDELNAFVRSMREKGILLGATCAATGYLAKLGLLNSTPHTSNSMGFLKQKAPGYSGESFYRNELAILDNNLVTASGLGAVEFAYKILEALNVYEPNVLDIWFRAFKHGEDPMAGKQ